MFDGDTISLSLIHLAKRAANTTAVFQYTTPGFPLSLWAGIARGIRVALRTSYRHVPLPPDLNVARISLSNYMGYYLPFAILVGLIILSLVFMMLLVGCNYCCLLCCRTCINRRRARPVKLGSKICCTASLAVLFLAVIVAVVGAVFASFFVTTTIQTFKTRSISSLDGARTLTLRVTPVVNQVFTDIKGLVNSTVDAVVNSTSMELLVDDANHADDNRILALASWPTSKQVSSNRIVSNVNGLSSPHAISAPYSWNVKSGQGPSAGSIGSTTTSLNTQTSNSPDSLTVLTSIQTAPNLTVFAVEVRNRAAAVSSTAAELVREGSETWLYCSFQGNGVPMLENARKDIVGQFDKVLDDGSKQIQSMRDSLSSYLTTATTYDFFRTIGQSGFAGLYILILIMMGIAMSCKAPRAIKGINLCCSPYYILLHLIAIVMLVVTVIMGDLCTVVFDGNPGFKTVELCYQNVSILTAVTQAGLLDAGVVNITKQAKSQIDSESIELSDSPQNKISSVTSLTTLQSSVTSFRSTATSSNNNQGQMAVYMDVTGGGSPSLATYQEANAALIVILDAVSADIALINSNAGYLDQLDAKLRTIKSQIISINATTHTLMVHAASLPVLYNSTGRALTEFAGNATQNLTLAIPDYVMASFPCYAVAEAVYSIQDGVCGVASLVSIPIVISVANAYFPVQLRTSVRSSAAGRPATDMANDSDGKPGKGKKGDKADQPPAQQVMGTREAMSPALDSPMPPYEPYQPP
ncbi:hypothetical protein BC831DRAFT_445352 [Entophlyctis helioformis]|nr:hypothetical protein BC831DRAFT_445352 [Entophlyctis helioformis]